jgi:membrane fusion protein (multidrug efflux system)
VPRVNQIMTEFPMTIRRLFGERGRTPVYVAGAGIALLAGWMLWASAAEITLYEVSTSARLEQGAAPYPIQTPVTGRVVATTLRVGRTVTAGEPLLDLEVESDTLRLREEQARARGWTEQVARLRAQADAERRARLEERRAADLAIAEAQSRTREAIADAQYADAEAARLERLHARDLLSDLELLKARAGAERLRALVAALQTAARRAAQDQVTRDRQRDVRIEQIGLQVAALDTQARAAEAARQRLTYEIDRRRVRAPVDGIVAEAAQVRAGTIVHEGEPLGSIVPPGQIVAVAQFPAERALGRIRPGQRATVRLAAYPWAEFGTLDAVVSAMASDVRDGAVRVELTVAPGARFRGTLDHGMPADVEIAAERITPLALVLRIAGQTFTASQ